MSEAATQRTREEADANRFSSVIAEKFSEREHGVPVRLTLPGRQSAIDRCCAACIYDPSAPGSWLVQVELCSAYSCPLWAYRPVRTEASRTPYRDGVRESYQIDPADEARLMADPHASPVAIDTDAEAAVQARREALRERGYQIEIARLERFLGDDPIDDAGLARYAEAMGREGRARLAMRMLEAAVKARERQTGQAILGPRSEAALARLG